ncbi:hypothetical protein SMA679_1375 [Streptococcus macedonicus]|uniref:lantibiotic dehydratase C-terminal domain-containing protein n=1 Tax=Streptococcus macedonicus TaxID=59310 RepID=UPI000811F051|nr:lantibiotic dehydratase C-terminal domain-containing protein [Streptococcus macedonicus]SCA89936.1 hypothetical protein SMA679_1375 [Streptococcus macedonicus]
MWESFQIYTDNPKFFFDNLGNLISSNKNFKDSFFFTQYYDAYGYHIRFRFNKHKKIFYNWINDNKFTYLKSIYDPDVIRYGDNNVQYEFFSMKTCYFIVSNNILSNLESRLSYAFELIILLVESFNVNNKQFFAKYIKFWGDSFKYINTNLKDIEYTNVTKNVMTKSHYVEICNLISDMDIENKEKMCFYFIHLTLNRLCFNIRDEITIINAVKNLEV